MNLFVECSIQEISSSWIFSRRQGLKLGRETKLGSKFGGVSGWVGVEGYTGQGKDLKSFIYKCSLISCCIIGHQTLYSVWVNGSQTCSAQGSSFSLEQLWVVR